MINNFNSNIAVEFGVDIAIFLQQLAQWSFLNLANKRNIHDGHVWSYNTLEAYTDIFPYWSKRQLERIIKSSIVHGLVKKGNYNKSKYDRTCWYALSVKGLNYFPELTTEKHLNSLNSHISPNGEIDFSERRNLSPQMETPIPTNKPTKDISKDISGFSEEKSCSSSILPKEEKILKMMLEDNPHEIEEEILSDWITVRKAKRAPITRTAWKNIMKELDRCLRHGLKPKDCFVAMVTSGWQSLNMDWFLNEEKPKNGKPSLNDLDQILRGA
ncbi:MAG TPA: hypothetical protein VHZ76_07200 [Gammaproteobacteria bacterium]|jgi:hypothetical protein|nr:hypothetical protein [Gammaproteobacteria bacterium]